MDKSNIKNLSVYDTLQIPNFSKAGAILSRKIRYNSDAEMLEFYQGDKWKGFNSSELINDVSLLQINTNALLSKSDAIIKQTSALEQKLKSDVFELTSKIGGTNTKVNSNTHAISALKSLMSTSVATLTARINALSVKQTKDTAYNKAKAISDRAYLDKKINANSVRIALNAKNASDIIEKVNGLSSVANSALTKAYTTEKYIASTLMTKTQIADAISKAVGSTETGPTSEAVTTSINNATKNFWTSTQIKAAIDKANANQLTSTQINSIVNAAITKSTSTFLSKNEINKMITDATGHIIKGYVDTRWDDTNTLGLDLLEMNKKNGGKSVNVTGSTVTKMVTSDPNCDIVTLSGKKVLRYGIRYNADDRLEFEDIHQKLAVSIAFNGLGSKYPDAGMYDLVAPLKYKYYGAVRVTTPNFKSHFMYKTGLNDGALLWVEGAVPLTASLSFPPEPPASQVFLCYWHPSEDYSEFDGSFKDFTVHSMPKKTLNQNNTNWPDINRALHKAEASAGHEYTFFNYYPYRSLSLGTTNYVIDGKNYKRIQLCSDTVKMNPGMTNRQLAQRARTMQINFNCKGSETFENNPREGMFYPEQQTAAGPIRMVNTLSTMEWVAAKEAGAWGMNSSTAYYKADIIYADEFELHIEICSKGVNLFVHRKEAVQGDFFNVHGASITMARTKDGYLYDSGWFAIKTNTKYNKTHNLGYQPGHINLMLRNSSGQAVKDMGVLYNDDSNFFGTTVEAITSNSYSVQGGVVSLWHSSGGLGQHFGTGFARVTV